MKNWLVFCLTISLTTLSANLYAGQKIIVEPDFDFMMQQAPVLDINDPAFNEKDAVAWHSAMDEMIQSILADRTSKEFEEGFTPIVYILHSAGETNYDTVSRLRGYVSVINGLPEKNKYDTFCKKYLVAYFNNMATTTEAVLNLADLIKELGYNEKNMPSSPELLLPKEKVLLIPKPRREEMARKTRSDEQTVRLLIFSPSMSMKNVDIRRKEWNLLNIVANKLEGKE